MPARRPVCARVAIDRASPPSGVAAGVLLLVGVGLVVAACGDSTGPVLPDRIAAVSGGGQSAAVTEELDGPLRVEVLDGGGRPIEGVSITWTAESGSGQVVPATSASDAQGLAEARWTLGAGAGTQRAAAAVDGVEPVGFQATAHAGPPVRLEEVGGAGQEGAAGRTLATPLTVRVLDEHGNGVPDVVVAWSATAGGGTVSPARPASDEEGLAAADWTLGTVAGEEQRALAAVDALGGLEFPAVALPGAVAEVILTPEGAEMVVGEARSFQAALADEYGNEVEASVGWSVSTHAVAEVDEAGEVVALAPGPTAVRASVGDVTGEVEIRVDAAAAPEILSVSPGLLPAGGTAVVEGTGFSPVPSWNRVTVEGHEAEVVSGTSTSLTIRVPGADLFECRPTRPASVAVSVRPHQATASTTLRVANPLELDPGGAALLDAGSEVACSELQDTSGEYLVAVFNTRQVPGSLTSFQVLGAAADGAAVGAGVVAAGRTPASASSTGGGLAQVPSALALSAGGEADTHLEILERSRVLAEELGPVGPRLAARAAAAEGAHGAAGGAAGEAQWLARASLEQGESRAMRVPSLSDLCESYDQVTARAAYVGSRTLILEDASSPLAGEMDDAFEALGDEFEQVMYPIVEEYFGDPLAMDAQLSAEGKVVMLFTPGVNAISGVAGFVSSSDFQDRSTCASSNETQVFYARVPTSVGGVDDWLHSIRATTIHEVKHLASFAARFSGDAATLEEVWLEESTARVAEELFARAHFGYGPAENVGYAESIGCERSCSGAPEVVASHFAGLYTYFLAPHHFTPIGPVSGGDFTFYGSGWFFVRWVADQFGASEAGFFRALNQEPELSGVQNLEARSDRAFEELLGPWALSLYADDRVPGASPMLQHPGWNLPDVFGGMHEEAPDVYPHPFPLTGWTLDYGEFAQDAAVRGGAAGFLLLRGEAQGSQLLQLRGGTGGPPPANLRMAVLRVK